MTAVYEVCGYIPYAKTEIGFALPIFFCKNSQRRFIQMPDISARKIRSFNAIDETADIIAFSKPSKLFKVGVDLQYIFCDKSHVYLGNIDNLKMVLEEISIRADVPASIAMQISEILSDGLRLNQNVERYLAILSDKKEIYSNRFIDSSLIRNHVWNHLVHACDYSQGEKLSLLLKEVFYGIRTDGKIIDFTDDLKENINLNLNVNVGKLISVINDTFSWKKVNYTESVNNYFENSDDKKIKKLIDTITYMPRQEARISTVIKTLIEDPQVGAAILNGYKDRASFANLAFRYIKKISEGFGPENWDKNAYFIVDWLYRECYPKQRGILLHELAVELGEYPAFANAINKKVSQSYAQPVLYAQKLIKLQLAHPDERVGRVYAETSNTLPHVVHYIDVKES